MPRTKRPSTQNEITITLRLLKLQLRTHPTANRLEAIDESIRQMRALKDEEQMKDLNALFNSPQASL